MSDERDELTIAQQLLNAGAALNEAVYELITLAQLKPAQLDHLALTSVGAGEGPYDAALDKISEALDHLSHLYQTKDAELLFDGARRWLVGEH